MGLCTGRIGLWDERTGFGIGMDFIWNIVLLVVRCGRFGELVIFFLFFCGVGGYLMSRCVVGWCGRNGMRLRVSMCESGHKNY